ncbi:hypothetical protein HPP92_017750 [Vanilla planifolia]|uniref:Uncharacterized protein n=1 Tax=Vanilla planifolia TaxID=51239 RepID=A0A835QG30_VANPL|nr:hypothetical protein HPP92_017750 [Vanilla planifolia]
MREEEARVLWSSPELRGASPAICEHDGLDLLGNAVEDLVRLFLARLLQGLTSHTLLRSPMFIVSYFKL